MPSEGQLSPREIQVIRLVARGLSNEAIAALLFVSVDTVKTHVRACFRRTRATNRVQLTVWAYQSGLVSISVATSFVAAVTRAAESPLVAVVARVEAECDRLEEVATALKARDKTPATHVRADGVLQAVKQVRRVLVAAPPEPEESNVD